MVELLIWEILVKKMNKILINFSLPTFKINRSENIRSVAKLSKELSKIMEQDSHKVDFFNQFIIGSIYSDSAELDILRIKSIIFNFHIKYIEKHFKIYWKKIKNDPELKASISLFKTLFKELQIKDDLNFILIKKLPDDFINQISKILSEGYSWITEVTTTAGINSTIRMGSTNYEFSLQKNNIVDLQKLYTELPIISLGIEHIPIMNRLVELITNSIDGYITQIEKLKSTIYINSVNEKELIIEVISLILGKILGIREAITTVQNLCKRYLELDNSYLTDESINQENFKEFLSALNIDHVRLNLRKLNDISNEIGNNVELFRSFLYFIENLDEEKSNQTSSTEFISESLKLYRDLENFRFFADSFIDISSYSPISALFVNKTEMFNNEVSKDEIKKYSILAKGLYKTYTLFENTVYALRGIDLKIEAGDFIAIMGPSGSGKTTLLNILSGIDRPDHGILYVNQKDFNKLTEKEFIQMRRDEFSFIYQSFNLLPILTSIENVSLPADLGTKNLVENRNDRAKELLQNVDLDNFVYTRPLILSGGQQQRVTISRALMNKQKIIFADEPTGDLDRVTGDQIMDIFENLHNKGVTIIIVTHDQNVALRANRIIHMMDGKITKIEEIKSKE
jgi:putative ABC transport system ATP-binding protein